VDEVAIVKCDPVDIASDPAAHLDRIDSLETSGEVVPAGHFTFQGLTNEDGRGRLLRWCAALAASQNREDHKYSGRVEAERNREPD
jgi:hypothetical protein